MGLAMLQGAVVGLGRRNAPVLGESRTVERLTSLRSDLDAKGRYRWRKRQRLIGKAFIGEQLGARLIQPDILAVYFGPHLLGHLHAFFGTDLFNMRHCFRHKFSHLI